MGGSLRRSHTNERVLVSAACSSDSGWPRIGARRAATRTGSPTLRGWTKSDSVAVDVASAAALTVDDRATLRVEDDRAGVLALGELVELAVLDHHQPAEATGEAAEREGEDRREHEDARPDGRILH